MKMTPLALAAMTLPALLAALPAQAVRSVNENGTELDFSSTLSFGLQVRAQNRSKLAIGNDNGGNVPTGAALGSQLNGPGNDGAANPDFNVLNADDGNLNYDRWDIVSAALKGTHEFGLKTTDGWRALVRGTWVGDFKAGDTRRTPLSEEAKKIATRNVTLLDAWVSKDLKFGDRNATVRLGNQVLSWGEDIFILGGINQINAFDLRKIHTPGTQVKEILRPAPMLSLNTGVTDTMSAEAYYQFRWNAFRFDPVGTFFSGADVVGAGQRPAYIPSSSLTGFGLCTAPTPCGDIGSGIQNGVNVVPFEDDKRPPRGGQFGLAMRFKPKSIDTEFALYYERYHDKLPFTTLFTDPTFAQYNAANIGYYNEYGKKKNLFGASFNTKLGPVAVGGELSYRPRDSVAIDPSVPFAGAYSIFDADTPGPTKTVSASDRITVRGYVEEKKVQAHLTALYFTEVNSPLGALVRTLGAAEGTLLAEVAVTHYPDLQLGKIPYLIFPSYESPTKTSWGYAMEFDLSYPRVWGSDWNLVQVTVFTHDVSGISPNTLPFVKGRKSLFVGFNFDNSAVWKAQFGYTTFFGGGFSNLIRDRDNLAASVSYSF
ncbi:MAG: DUF1302 domain-containing protein [Piscinibacter sp.]|uniref:DUF1302 domain-containing protein n=1 Tax=Piscinibacter sp. TaxID=1903157 RepID=UPI002587EA1A|nr:DUF1302 domain-containing protein [Piscinibacter sp.]MCW5663086.1 DUF1302 domain-containing protein [Piscinibacter sp.]